MEVNGQFSVTHAQGRAAPQRARSKDGGEEKLGPVLGPVWFASLVLSPFYLLPSGLPQLDDLLAISLAGAVFLRLGWRTLPPLATLAALLFGLVAYVFFVNLAWGALTGNPSIMVKPAYYLFNFAVFVTFLVLYGRTGRTFLRITLSGVSASVFLQVLLSLVVDHSDQGLRQSLFFNNPNQLGYYALISTAIFAFANQYMKVHPLHDVAFFLAAIYLTLLSLSKAALLGVAILCLILLIRKPAIGLALAVSLSLWLYLVPAGQEMRLDLEKRFTSVGVHEDDSLLGRGYDRIVHHYNLLPLGAGEGNYGRFRSQISGSEMHSSWGTILFSYGFPGSVLFFLFLVLVFVQAGPASLFYFMPVALYGLTHNGLRFSLLWIFLAFIVCVAHSYRRRPSDGRRVSAEPTPVVELDP